MYGGVWIRMCSGSASQIFAKARSKVEEHGCSGPPASPNALPYIDLFAFSNCYYTFFTREKVDLDHPSGAG